MVDEEHLAILRNGLEQWNVWREANPQVRPSLSGANLGGQTLSCAPMTWDGFQTLNFRDQAHPATQRGTPQTPAPAKPAGPRSKRWLVDVDENDPTGR